MKLTTSLLTALILTAFGVHSFSRAQEAPQNGTAYSFVVAGHAYGSHSGSNIGFYPKFFQTLKKELPSDAAFIFFTGDIVRHPSPAAWQSVQDDLATLPVPAYFAMGNHDYDTNSIQLMHQKFGGTYYAIKKGPDLFVVLDTQKITGRISDDQLAFLTEKLKTCDAGSRVFIFIHELLWTAHRPKYRQVRHNFGSYNRYFRSNFWEALIPILFANNDKTFYVFAGDVGGNRGAIAAYYEKVGNTHLIASGMGEVPDENFLTVRVTPQKVSFKLVPLNPGTKLGELEDYTP